MTDLASFVLRRTVCGLSTRGYDQWLVRAIGEIKHDPRADLQQYYLGRGWPSDQEFAAALLKFGLYHREPSKTRLILERLEDSYGHKEKVDKGVLTVEHVLPQTPSEAAVAEWKALLVGGDNWYPAHQEWVHTLGNLTLTGYNRELSNRPYSEKQPELLKSNLLLNKYFDAVSLWGPAEVEARGKMLAAEVAALWPNPVQMAAESAKRPKGQKLEFDIAGLRESSMARLCRHFSQSFYADGEARFVAAGNSSRIVCLASRPYPNGDGTGYWFGLTPEQLDFLRRGTQGYLALCCGSPDRILLFDLLGTEGLTQSMNVTEGASGPPPASTAADMNQASATHHWHVQLFWGNTVELDQPKKGERANVTKNILSD